MKLPEPFTYFVDRSLGREHVVAAMRGAGENVYAHDDHFAQNTPDVTWLEEVGRRGWVVLTKDKNIRANELERVTLIQAKVACFMLGRGDLAGPTMGATFVQALPRMRKALRRFEIPLVASVSAAGGVRVLIAAAEWLSTPKELK